MSRIPDTAGPNVTELYNEFMEVLPDAVNQRFYSPVVQDALDNALQSVAAGLQSADEAMADVQAAQDQVLAAG